MLVGLASAVERIYTPAAAPVYIVPVSTHACKLGWWAVPCCAPPLIFLFALCPALLRQQCCLHVFASIPLPTSGLARAVAPHRPLAWLDTAPCSLGLLFRAGNQSLGVAASLRIPRCSQCHSLTATRPMIDRSGAIDFEEFVALTKHLRLDLSREKALKIFALVDHDQKHKLSLFEFEEAVEEVEMEVVRKALELLGLSRTALVGAAVASVGMLLMLLGFVLLGAAVFSDGATFGSVVSALLPLSAGAGLRASAKLNSKDYDVKSKVEEALDVLRY